MEFIDLDEVAADAAKRYFVTIDPAVRKAEFEEWGAAMASLPRPLTHAAVTAFVVELGVLASLN